MSRGLSATCFSLTKEQKTGRTTPCSCVTTSHRAGLRCAAFRDPPPHALMGPRCSLFPLMGPRDYVGWDNVWCVYKIIDDIGSVPQKRKPVIYFRYEAFRVDISHEERLSGCPVILSFSALACRAHHLLSVPCKSLMSPTLQAGADGSV